MATSPSLIQIKYNQWNDCLFKRYIQLFPEEKHTTIWDGVVSPDDYEQAPLKVMILNREGYTEKNNDYCLNKKLKEQIDNGETIFAYQKTMRTHLKQYLAVLNSIGPNGFTSLTDEAIQARVSNINDEEFNSLINKVAYCNVKKSDGTPKSNRYDLQEYASKGLDILIDQIRFFSPSIILAGDVCDGILESLVNWGEDLYIGPDRRICIWQLKIGEKSFPFVDMFHPSRTQGMNGYYLELLHALQAVEKKDPKFWLRQLDKECFSTL